jgi:hypothetical protein
MKLNLVIGLILATLSTSAIASEALPIDSSTYYAALREAQGHPNEVARWRGMWSFSNRRFTDANRQLERAAFFGDKPSQFLLSVMYQEGNGVARDPVLAYIWAELAAERDTPQMVRIKEKLWTNLSPEQQARVEAQRGAFYERYGDRVAKVRTNVQLTRFSRERTGSRTGVSSAPMTTTLGAMSPVAGCKAVDADRPLDVRKVDLYALDRIDRDAYWKQQDVVLQRIAGGRVWAGDLEQVQLRTP